MKNLLIFLSLLLCLMSGHSAELNPAFADDDDRSWEDDESHDRAQSALQRGEVLPIQELLGRVREQISGEIIGMEFEREYNLWVYELKVIDESGRLLEVYVDAKTGTILTMEKD